MQAEIRQKNGLLLSILRCPSGRAGCIVVRLMGTTLNAEMTAEKYPAYSKDKELCEFFGLAAQLIEGNTCDWLSECQDFAVFVSTDALFPGQISLRIYLGSTSDDDCDWQINGSLIVEREQLSRFAEELALI